MNKLFNSHVLEELVLRGRISLSFWKQAEKRCVSFSVLPLVFYFNALHLVSTNSLEKYLCLNHAMLLKIFHHERMSMSLSHYS
jgi:hypothetical protein